MCAINADFDNHIYVTTDAEAFFFLHDLITSYMKEKERVRTMQQQQSEKKLGTKDKRAESSSPSSSLATTSTPTSSLASASSNALVSSMTDPLNKDWRRFECNTWHLEPTVRLISWAGSEIEPYGVDYILQRLGFSHARITIPKWLQRGCMDPLDKAISVLVMRAIQLVQEEKGQQQQQQQSVQEETTDNKRKRPI